ncbi:MAG: hypothetical protein Q8K24_08975 [Hydrogenophaga sp.]|nr:hypothetical protein [Hydrogenophaga sp.]
MKTAVTLALLISTAASAQHVVTPPQRLCLAAIVDQFRFKDPASARIESAATWGSTTHTNAAGAAVPAARHTLIVNARNSYGAYAGAQIFECLLTLDEKRVLAVKSF